ncbi:IS1182 family transposase [Microcoleus sp. Pol17_C1]|uniref:IS1182 family transposase n=1 Tax=unclassified Microcoleus TaxID=2642155 RepID=UPI002FD679B0
MRPPLWHPPIELSETEALIIKRIKRAKLFTFLRLNRSFIFNDEFQEQLATIFKDSTVGQGPVPPAQIALAIILQAYLGISDDEVIEEMLMDQRWQLVLDCLKCETPPFSKATLVRFRNRLIKKELDQRLIDRTVEIAKQKGGFGSSQLKAADNSSPLWGAGKVEDTYNLLGHALRKAVSMIAAVQGREPAEIALEAGAPILNSSSLKTALDLNWDNPVERQNALLIILSSLNSVEEWMQSQSDCDEFEVVQETLDVARVIESQNVTFDSQGVPSLSKGVAKDRRISIEDPDMRHGRKSRSKKIDGYKRHVLKDLESGVVCAVALTRANTPESAATIDLERDLKFQNIHLSELHIDRAYLSSHWVTQRNDKLQIFCKAWPVKNSGRFDKNSFFLDWDTHLISCPNQVSIPFEPGKTVHFPQNECAICPLRSGCTNSKRGRTVSIHPDEALMQELRARQSTAIGRIDLRKRTTVEHSLAHIGYWQGNRARYIGLRKNLFDLRRVAVVHNLHVIARMDKVRPITPGIESNSCTG